MTAFAGGLLIGLATLLLYAALGKIAGISGIAFGALERANRSWRLPFLIGLVGGGWAAVLMGAPMPQPQIAVGAAGSTWLLAAGLLVGAGTSLGNGCTSGHGVCGLARLSRRSLAAVAVFMATGILVATLVHYLDLRSAA